MTRRERLERKLEKRKLWQESRKRQAEEHFKKADQATAGIPFGQPILVGHHSERRHRAAIERGQANGFAGVADLKMADTHASKAAGIEAALDSSVFSDDVDAVEQLEQRIKDNEAKAERYTAINKAWRKCKGDVAAMVATGLVGQALAESMKRTMELCPWHPTPMGLDLTSVRASIRRDKKRIESINNANAILKIASDAGGVEIKEKSNGYCYVIFAEKPDYSLITDLKNAGFHWSRPCWYGETSKIPESVRALKASV